MLSRRIAEKNSAILTQLVPSGACASASLDTAAALVLCRNCGANLARTIHGHLVQKLDEAHGVIERTYHNALYEAPPGRRSAWRLYGTSVSSVRG